MGEQEEKLINSAPCEHFSSCGGCNLQHMNEAEYYSLKESAIHSIINRLDSSDTNVNSIIKIKTHERRRAEFKISVNKKQIALGFFTEKTNYITDLKMCLIVEQKIFELSQKFKTILADLKKPGNIEAINITNLANGFDVFVKAKAKFKDSDKEKIINFATDNNIIRLAEQIGDDELKIIHQTASPQISFAGYNVDLPLGAFLQATKLGQEEITNFILQHSKSSKNIVDLYSGCGTYSLPMAVAGKLVTAYEGDYDMALALNAAARANDFDKSLSAQSRDLYKKPLRSDALNSFDTAIINPPRNGALPQIKQLASSNITNIIMVSCNPQSFERDAQHLLENGFVMENIVPIDQFYWSNHLELAANFRK